MDVAWLDVDVTQLNMDVARHNLDVALHNADRWQAQDRRNRDSGSCKNCKNCGAGMGKGGSRRTRVAETGWNWDQSLGPAASVFWSGNSVMIHEWRTQGTRQNKKKQEHF